MGKAKKKQDKGLALFSISLYEGDFLVSKWLGALKDKGPISQDEHDERRKESPDDQLSSDSSRDSS